MHRCMSTCRRAVPHPASQVVRWTRQHQSCRLGTAGPQSCAGHCGCQRCALRRPASLSPSDKLMDRFARSSRGAPVCAHSPLLRRCWCAQIRHKLQILDVGKLGARSSCRSIEAGKDLPSLVGTNCHTPSCHPRRSTGSLKVNPPPSLLHSLSRALYTARDMLQAGIQHVRFCGQRMVQDRHLINLKFGFLAELLVHAVHESFFPRQ